MKDLKANAIKFELTRNGEKVSCEVAILDKICMFKFNKKGIAQEVYEWEKRNAPQTICRYDNRRDVYSEIHIQKDRDALTAYVKQKLLDAGAKEVSAP